MRYYYTLLLIVGLSLVACQQPVQPETNPTTAQSPQTDAEELLEQRFESAIEANHRYPIQVNKELNRLARVVNKQSDAPVQKILAQYRGQGSTNISPNEPDEQPLQKADSLPSIVDMQIVNPITRNGGLLLRVRDCEETNQKIEDLVEQNQALIVSQESNNYDSLSEHTLVIHSPVQNFETIIKELRDMAAVVRRKRIWQEDLTADLVNIETKLEYKEKSWQKLEKFRKEADSKAEMEALIDRMDNIEEDMSTLTQTLDTLRRRAAYSIITVSHYQEIEKPILAQADFGDRFSGGLSQGWVDFKDFTIRATTVWPYIVICLLFLLTVMLAVRSSKGRARQFQMQAMQAQQQWLIQQQKMATNQPKSNPTGNKTKPS